MPQKDPLGDRMKDYERRETDRRMLPMVPIVARMDGRGFSKFTRGLERPYDISLSEVMIETTKRLVEATHARMGYTQSDEITLVWLVEDITEQMMFDGKVQKLSSVLASMTTAFFITESLRKEGTEIANRALRAPHFDARVFQVPSRTEAANAVLWRERDAAKNSVSMAARAHYSHGALQGKNAAEMNEMLFQKGVNFNDYPAFFKRGSFLQARTRQVPLDAETLARIPEAKRPSPDHLVTRRAVEVIDMPIFSKVVNREDVIFEGAEPLLAENVAVAA